MSNLCVLVIVIISAIISGIFVLFIELRISYDLFKDGAYAKVAHTYKKLYKINFKQFKKEFEFIAQNNEFETQTTPYSPFIHNSCNYISMYECYMCTRSYLFNFYNYCKYAAYIYHYCQEADRKYKKELIKDLTKNQYDHFT